MLSLFSIYWKKHVPFGWRLGQKKKAAITAHVEESIDNKTGILVKHGFCGVLEGIEWTQLDENYEVEGEISSVKLCGNCCNSRKQKLQEGNS